MTSPGLQTRITSLSTTHKQTIPLIQRLQNLPAIPGSGDDARLELGAEIHLRLKEMEEQMELLRVELEQLETLRNRKRETGAMEAERERVVVVIGKLEEDLKSARIQFRKAQLQAKRNAEAARRKERQLLFAGAERGEAGSEGGRRKGRAGLTHDDLVAGASEDITAALRRTHQLMQAELSRSKFAQETLEQSTAALSSLSESYSTLDTLLASSRSLAVSLLRSQKSDTWYLETAFYILIGTIIWLVFRRILYGPLWWMLWMPLKLMVRTILPVLGGIGLANKSAQLPAPSATSISLGNPGASVLSETPSAVINGATLESESPPLSLSSAAAEPMGTHQAESESILDEVENIVKKGNDNHDKGTNVDDISPEERRRQEQLPRNPKKRMHEEPIQDEHRKDEL
ncbi:protein transporter SEC20 [Blastomyces parvus]|uniref:Protein transporter SEC20 n=1 Tax=Blastomyces parvus TaxID=2060905 RepID=A0A2B7X9Q9_9EURO|nr:protein transporter SEC20 [Blastomyces parvus]